MKANSSSYSQFSIFKRLLKDSKRYFPHYILLCTLALILSLIGVAEAEVIRRMVNGATELEFNMIISGATLFLIIIIISISLDWLKNYSTSKLNLKATTLFQVKVLDKLNRMKLTDYQNFHSGDVLSRVHDSVNAAQTGLNHQMIHLIQNFGTVIFLIIYLSILNLKLTLFSLLFAILIPVMINFLSNYIRKNYDYYQKEEASYQSFLQESFQGTEVIKSFSLLSFFNEKFKTIYARMTHFMRKIALFESTLNQTATILSIGGMLFILFYGGSMVFQDELDLGAVIAFLVSFERIVFPLSSLLNSWPQLQHSISAGKRVYDLLDLAEEENVSSQSIISKRTDTPIVNFKGVSYRYEDSSNKVIDRLNMTFKTGEKTAIIGPSGSGKSTILKILMQFIQPIEGEVIFNELNIDQIPLDDWRNNISYVSQDTTLFTDTIFNNIRYGNLNATEEEVIKAAKSASIHEDIMKTQNGYQTMLDEDGLNLSGGQRQRLALARALLRKPLIYILDEPTSSLDGATERHFTQTLNDLMMDSHAIYIIVSHRLETIRSADYIYVLEEGRIVEEGQHGELYKQKGLYHHYINTDANSGGDKVYGTATDEG